MESFLNFFELMPVWMKAAWIFIVLGVFWIAEGYYSQINFNYKKWRHARVNASLLLMVMAINVGFGTLTALLYQWLDSSSFGLLQMVDWPVWVELILALVVLDFIAQYLVHFLLHKVPALWRLHLVHHSDKKVDVTTGTRHHPLDFLLRETFALIAIALTGMPLSFYLFYRILSVLFTYFTHANIALPLAVDKAISYVFVTPNMHKFHHHNELPWTDSNYGNMLSVWDRLFGTFVYGDVSKVVYGVDIADHKDDQNLWVQLGIPFDRSVKSKS